MPEIFSTTDISASVHKAHKTYTHVLVNRSYTTIKPVFFKSELIADLPVHFYAPWDRGTIGSRNKWQKNGGVLVDQGTISKDTGERDALIFVECPLSVDRLNKSFDGTEKQVIIFMPPSWNTHEWAADKWNPSADTVRQTRAFLREVPDRAKVAAVTKYPDSLFIMTDSELATAAGIPLPQIVFARRVLKPKEVWSIRAHLEPTEPVLKEAWDAIMAHELVDGARLVTRLELSGAWKRPVKMMAKEGYISATKLQVFPTTEPDYDRLQENHDKAIADLEEMKELMKGLPNHGDAK